MVYFHVPEKEEQSKPQTSRIEKVIKIKVEILEIDAEKIV